MIIKKYIGNNVKEALIKVEKELGKDAVIISQRAVRQGGIKGLFSPKVIEITAAVESKEKETQFNDLSKSYFSKPEKAQRYNEDNDIKREVEEMKSILNAYLIRNNENLNSDNLNKNVKEEEHLKDKAVLIKEAMTSLENFDISKELIEEIETELLKQEGEPKDKNEVISKVKLIMKEFITVATKDIKGRIALVGPTGVGKTTTIAKLAGNLALVQKKKVGLVTVDTYRIGAVEQLRTYAEIMNIKFKVVFSIGEMEEAIEAMKDCDVILIDTTGRSSKNAMQVLELKAYIDKAKVNDVFLVVSATTKGRDMNTIAEGFSQINCSGIVITKLDETASYGSIASVCNKTRLPINYITFGQSVPEDIRIPAQEEIIELILGEKDLC